MGAANRRQLAIEHYKKLKQNTSAPQDIAKSRPDLIGGLTEVLSQNIFTDSLQQVPSTASVFVFAMADGKTVYESNKYFVC